MRATSERGCRAIWLRLAIIAVAMARSVFAHSQAPEADIIEAQKAARGLHVIQHIPVMREWTARLRIQANFLFPR